MTTEELRKLRKDESYLKAGVPLAIPTSTYIPGMANILKTSVPALSTAGGLTLTPEIATKIKNGVDKVKSLPISFKDKLALITTGLISGFNFTNQANKTSSDSPSSSTESTNSNLSSVSNNNKNNKNNKDNKNKYNKNKILDGLRKTYSVGSLLLLPIYGVSKGAQALYDDLKESIAADYQEQHLKDSIAISEQNKKIENLLKKLNDLNQYNDSIDSEIANWLK